MKITNIVINWLMLLVGAGMISDIVGYCIVSINHPGRQWQGWLTHYFYASAEILEYLATVLVIFGGIKLLLIAADRKN